MLGMTTDNNAPLSASYLRESVGVCVRYFHKATRGTEGSDYIDNCEDNHWAVQ